MNLPDKKPIIEFTYMLRSRYGETDRMGYVYYGRYLEYFEAARTELIRSCGFTYREMEESGIMLPVIHAEVEYKAPVLYDEMMHIKVLIYEIPKVRLQTYYEIRTEKQDAVHATGEVTLVFMEAESRRPRKAPGSFLRGIEDLIQ